MRPRDCAVALTVLTGPGLDSRLIPPIPQLRSGPPFFFPTHIESRHRGDRESVMKNLLFGTVIAMIAVSPALGHGGDITSKPKVIAALLSVGATEEMSLWCAPNSWCMHHAHRRPAAQVQESGGV
jgi:hypothetical protein